MMRTSPSTRILIAAAGMLGALSGTARAERPLLADELPPDLEGVGIVERLDEQIPLDLEFVDDTGRTITLGEYFDGERPVILTMNFYRCEMLCNLTLNGVAQTVSELAWTPGDEFELITASIAPEEGPELAAVKKKNYLTQFDLQAAENGWHFLTGTKENIEALARAVGFGYRRVEKTDKDYDYAHTASIMFLTPDGRLSLYMNDVRFDAKDVRFALVEASKGAIGSPMDKFLLFFCYRYDPSAGSYTASVMKLMRLAAILTVLMIVGGILILRRRGPRVGSS